ncbi:MAG: hypothetical protein GY948_20730, partial [Alphaproteobacteria bacterium]|nr:hypothetical protein [Alphaproteobacteria bacterium]
GGLDRRLRIFRLPDDLHRTQMSNNVPVTLNPDGDNPIWVRVTTEDGYNGWSSPMFVYR